LVLRDSVLCQEILGEAQERIIHYGATDGLADPVTLLKNRLAKGTANLKFEPERGYLKPLLKELRVPVSSQVLVFSKTSSQHDQTSPQTPRAIYFSDNVSVGWVPGGAVIDLAAVDPGRGPIFYTLAQKPELGPRFERRADCMQCHFGNKTFFVPGLLVRSVYTSFDGTPLARVDGFISGHNSPLRDRWGGWYVTGTASDDFHLGNLFATNTNNPEQLDISAGVSLTDLRGRFDTTPYLSTHSDIVALLVLEHQVRMQNLITMANYETRYALSEQEVSVSYAPISLTQTAASDWPQQRIALAGERLLEYMLFLDEAQLKGTVKGASTFAAEFQLAGPHDSKGRSLRQLDLKMRLFRYPCSFLIYSDAFEALPLQMKNYVWQRLEQILTGKDNSPSYALMSAADRQAVLEILRETKPEFAKWLRAQTFADKIPSRSNSH